MCVCLSERNVSIINWKSRDNHLVLFPNFFRETVRNYDSVDDDMWFILVLEVHDLILVLQVTSMGNTMICWGFLSMEASPQRATTCFWETTWTGGSSLWKPSVSCWPTKSNTLRTSSCWGETMSVLQSTEYMASTMSVSRPNIWPMQWLNTVLYTMSSSTCEVVPHSKK